VRETENTWSRQLRTLGVIKSSVIPWDLLDAARRDVEKELTLSIKLVVVVVVN